MASPVSSNSINDQAVRWAVGMAYGERTAESLAELNTWLAADTRHRGAFMRARAWMRATENAVVEANSATAQAADIPAPASKLAMPDYSAPASDNDNTPGPLRRGFVRWSGRAAATGGAIAACVVAMIAVGMPVLAPFQRPQLASTGEVVALKDGSIATLGPDAKIEITLSPEYRRIRLVSGTATFKVFHDKSRPFVVQSGDVYAQATGTVYSVSRAGLTGGTVKVTEGSVLVWPRDERDQAVLVHAGGSVSLDPGPRPLLEPKATAAIAPRLPPPELAQISLDNVPIKSAVARFNRVNSTQIVIADPTIGDTTIIGLYRANDPEAFAQAVSTVSGSQIEYQKGKIVIKMK